MVRRRRLNKRSEWRMVIETDPPFDVLAATYVGAAEGFGDFRPMFKRIAPAMSAGLAANLRGGGAPINETWPDPKPTYGSRKMRDGFGSRQLIRSGDYLARLSAARIVRIGKFSMTVGLTGKEAKKSVGLNFGFRLGPRARPHFGFSRTMSRTVVDETQIFVDRVLDRAVSGGAA